MDELGRISCEECSDALKSLSEALNRYSIYGYDTLCDAIASLSSVEFADEVVDIVGSEYNAYDIERMYQRMEDTLDLLRRGISQDKIKELLETQTEYIAMDFVRRGF